MNIVSEVKFKFSPNGNIYSGEFAYATEDGINVIIDENCIHFVPNDLIVELIEKPSKITSKMSNEFINTVSSALNSVDSFN